MYLFDFVERRGENFFLYIFHLLTVSIQVYLPACYQGLLLLFAVLIQITINIQWIMNSPAGITFLKEVSQTNRLIFTAENLNAMKENSQLCKTSFAELRISLIYIDFLIILVAGDSLVFNCEVTVSI